MALKPTAKKGSVATEAVLGQAAQQITKAISELNAATATVSKLVSESEELTLLVSNKESQIAELEVQYSEKSRQAQVDFDLNMKSYTERVVNEYLKTSGKVAVPATQLETLEKELAYVKANAESDTKKQVAVVSSTLKAQFDNDIRFLQSENKAVAAENASKIGVLQEKNKFLEEQVTKLYQQLDAERSASIERAKASSVGSINLTGPSK